MKTPPRDMFISANRVLKNAYCPYSNFPVAACIKTDDGNLYSSINVENACYNLGTCAETNAIASMVAEGKKTISAILILTPTQTLTPPCGGCRQRIAEFSQPTTPVHLCTTDEDYQSYTVGELIPSAFGPNNMEKS